jgi:hypothetical protein
VKEGGDQSRPRELMDEPLLEPLELFFALELLEEPP